MPRIVVDVMLKPEILDPQGQAISGALPTLGISGVRAVRQGKHFELDLDGDESTALQTAQQLAGTLLANPVIEDFEVRLAATVT
jgi:phosphoribosylformylglycinamidine synthase